MHSTLTETNALISEVSEHSPDSFLTLLTVPLAEYVVGLSMISRGHSQDKLKWTFQLYDKGMHIARKPVVSN